MYCQLSFGRPGAEGGTDRAVGTLPYKTLYQPARGCWAKYNFLYGFTVS